MDGTSPIVAAWLWLGATGLFGHQHYGQFHCEGQFGRFANGQLASMPSQLTFVIDWELPGIVTDDGIPGRITAWTPIEVAFDVQYPAYKASYFINRIDGSISERSNFGGVFRGNCDLTRLDTKF